MNPTEPNTLSRLIARLSDGVLSAEESARLNELLRADPVAQEAYLDHLALDGWLECEFGGELPEVRPIHGQIATPRRATGWFEWLSRPAFAAFLLVLGIAMGATAYAVTTRLIARQTSLRLPLVETGFEAPKPPLAQGVPTRFGVWCGDFAESVGAESGIVPPEGRRMLRFLRSDSEVEPAGAATFVGDMFQVVDLRVCRDLIAGGNAVAELSASFNCVPGDGMSFQTCLWAFSGDPVALPRNWAKQLREDLAYGSGTAPADGDPQSWQRVTGRMIIPANADLLLIELKVFPKLRKTTNGPVVFAGAYADDVELVVRSGTVPQPLPRARGH